MESSWRFNTWDLGLANAEVNTGVGTPRYQQLCSPYLASPHGPFYVLNYRLGIYAVTAVMPSDMSDPITFGLTVTSGLVPHFPYGIPVVLDVPM